MRPTLSAIGRQVLSESASADEAVDVQPATLVMPNYDDPRRRESGLSPEHAEEQKREYEKIVKRSHAFVSTDRWREAVVRTYTYLDSHESVGNVVVIPVAVHTEVMRKIFVPRRGEINRAIVMTQDEARSKLKGMGVDLPSVGPREIVFVPMVGGNVIIYPDPASLPTSWMTVHAMFDDFRGSLTECRKVRDDLMAMFELASYGSIPYLFNCGWSETSFNMIKAAHSVKMRSGSRDGIKAILKDRFKMPAVGKRYRSVESVPVHGPDEGHANVLEFTHLGPSDIAAEAMTIAATKPEGFQPVITRLFSMPDEVLWYDIFRHSGELNLDVDQVYRKNEHLNEIIPTPLKARLFSLLQRDLEEIKKLTGDVRERLVQDLLGKAVLIAVH
jgi:hypothetical protein